MLTAEEAARLAELEAALAEAGGRGVELADEIDDLRTKARLETVRVTLTLAWDPREGGHPVHWLWPDLLDMHPDRVLKVEAT